MGSRTEAIQLSERYFDEGGFMSDLARRVAIRTESQEQGRDADLAAYLRDEIAPTLERLGYRSRILPNPVAGYGPFLIAERDEDPALPTVLTYGHGDVIRGQDEQWLPGLSPWRVMLDGEKIYGRGTADNKGQHTINIAALAAVIEARGGRLGFNSRILIEMGEETGSPGLNEVCAANRATLKADILVGSDGPRVKRDRPAIVMGTRGVMNFDLSIDLREGGHHSGNWGGLLANPGVILANAIASIIDAKGRIQVAELKPAPIPNSVRRALASVELEGGPGAPAIDAWWGEAGLTPVERVFAWNTFEVLAFKTGNPDRPVNAIPPRAHAHCQIRYVVGSDAHDFLPAIERHLARHGFGMVKVTAAKDVKMGATRLDPEHPWALWCAASVERTVGARPDVIPNLGGSLPNDVFTETLGMPTLWLPHSYGACSQHAPNEHMLAPLAREGLRIMTGIFWDMGEPGSPARAA